MKGEKVNTCDERNLVASLPTPLINPVRQMNLIKLNIQILYAENFLQAPYCTANLVSITNQSKLITKLSQWFF